MTMRMGTRARALVQSLMFPWIPATAGIETEIWVSITITYPSEARGHHIVVRDVAM